ncbi:RNA polymerase sigma factor [Sphingobacterium chungjuense]|uniref:RNA polymerase sigma factor n=1 Tax=Sphingobacterium chungjuense TaxID=2675553 RepID=UPI001408DA7A|nr:sigma-70 family RNA polymerase sigma factor [Sphingobacterium chungjuense]
MTIEEIENVLLVISDKSYDEDSAVAAFTTLYHGYSKFLNSVVSSVLKNSGIYDEQILNTVVNNTFYKLYENPLIFSFPEKAVDDKGFKAWLSRVAKNEFKRLLAEYYKDTTALEKMSSEPAIESEELAQDLFTNVNFKVLDEALNMLSERDRHILLTLYLYYEEGKNTPSVVLKMLCKIYDTTHVNIRKIKERSEKKIVEYFLKHTQLTPLKHVK